MNGSDHENNTSGPNSPDDFSRLKGTVARRNMATASLVCAVIALLTMQFFFISLPLGGTAVILALLSRGHGRTHGRARIAVIGGAAAMFISSIVTIYMVRQVYTNPALRSQVENLYNYYTGQIPAGSHTTQESEETAGLKPSREAGVHTYDETKPPPDPHGFQRCSGRQLQRVLPGSVLHVHGQHGTEPDPVSVPCPFCPWRIGSSDRCGDLVCSLPFNYALTDLLLAGTRFLHGLTAAQALRSVGFLILGGIATMAMRVFFVYPVSQALWLYIDHQEYSGVECLTKSIQLMRGQIVRYLKLELSFAGYLALSILSLGVGLIWVIPYINVAKANFYMDLTGTYKPY